ncbi:YopX family protein, partial [Bacillus sonorensis]|uniref:YopX family protein n=1 Tax=Bacillus sonorensis TaxID=119858 RepID=UPI0022808AB2
AVLMWGSGEKDKKSRPIYDRDVYHQGDPNILYVVEYKGASFVGKQIGSSSYAGLEHWKGRIEVIGDVYRNPELLEAAE